MVDLTSNYAGITLHNPIVVASSGLTNSAKKIEELAAAGAGAVVLKSLFEEQIDSLSASMSQAGDYPEAADYISEYVKANEIGKYLDLIREAKSRVQIPIIASVNCYKSGEWTSYARQIAEAGADAIEVNIMRLEGDVKADASALIESYASIVRDITKAVSIPVQVKLAKYFSCLPALIEKLRQAGAAGITIFNRSYQMDINIETESIVGGEVFTTPETLSDTLRYTGILAAKVPQLPISATTGIHDHEAVIKCIMAGASSTQICSVLYRKGANHIKELLDGLTQWMEKKMYTSLSEFRGKLKAQDSGDGTQYMRMQFMKYFSNKE